MKKIIVYSLLFIVFTIAVVALCQVLGFNVLMAAAETQITGLWILVAVLLLVITFVALVWIISIFNSLIHVRNNIMKAWKNIDVVLLQRHDEVSKLVDIYKTYTDYEKDVLLTITQLRSDYLQKKDSMQKTNIENDLNGKIGGMLACFENYPELKAIEGSARIMDAISRLESVIAGRRAFFNDTVKVYNAQIESFPYLIFARIMGLRQHPYLNEFEAAALPKEGGK